MKHYCFKDRQNTKTYIMARNITDAVRQFSALRKDAVVLKVVDSCYDADLDEYQKWVDYDMKKYGHISEETNEKLREAGLEVVRDEYGDYEVIAKETHDDIEKSSGGWVNRGEEGSHGKFATKKEAREQQKAMFANGYRADSIHDDDRLDLAQKWIDYDMKRYGKISETTKHDVEKMGLQIVKIGNEYSADLKDETNWEKVTLEKEAREEWRRFGRVSEKLQRKIDELGYTLFTGKTDRDIQLI